MILQPQHVALFAIVICIPLGLKLGIPTLLHQVERAGWLKQLQSQNPSLSKVESIHNGILLIKTPAGEMLRVKLAGLDLNTPWQNQAEGIMTMLMQTTQPKVIVSHM
ncbi:hypothetical protein [Leptolyngbya sp. GGD]|uniref:hypothetical protein n=1 Tax=Leptolyngbya sp. GGD TaxID=2997907 RepID=UPI00227AE2D3|nr:hypothetical protein [Leptolyngbya sp. GGD]MCY6493375.1 hypothetical protein [Leptolyngbya sp. GGD]